MYPCIDRWAYDVQPVLYCINAKLISSRSQLVAVSVCCVFFGRRQTAYIGVIERCYSKLGLESLTRDASVNDVQMESCCRRLLQLHEMSVLTSDLSSCRLKVAQFYSVMSDGDICVPWNFEDVA